MSLRILSVAGKEPAPPDTTASAIRATHSKPEKKKPLI
jgi:hypothetical protein